MFEFTPLGIYEALPIMGKGMLGIFVVTLVIIGIVWALNFFTSPREKK